MAGGRGTRISSIASDIPKPMITIGEKPVLEREIQCLKKQGLTDIIITVSHLANIIIDYFGDGSKFGVRIEYFIEEKPLGNAGALFEIKDKLSDDFLLLNADSMFDIDFSKFIDYHKSKKALVTLFTHPNSHPFDSGLIVTDDSGAVTNWFEKSDQRPLWYKNRVNAGIHIINKSILTKRPLTEKVNLDSQLLKPLQGTGKMFAYDSPEYVRDMGTPERYFSVCEDFRNGIIANKNLRNKQKAIFLDRDGTINKYVGFLKKIEQFELNNGIEKTLKAINSSDYLAIVITNQPVVARGEVTYDELQEIHNKMETLLGNYGVFVDAIYYCPHHPHKGFEGEIPELKIDCECRKPKPGLIFRAAEDFNIDLSKSWMIGDEDSDVLAGKSAGCQTVKIKRDSDFYNEVYSIIGGSK